MLANYVCCAAGFLWVCPCTFWAYAGSGAWRCSLQRHHRRCARPSGLPRLQLSGALDLMQLCAQTAARGLAGTSTTASGHIPPQKVVQTQRRATVQPHRPHSAHL